MQFRLRTLLIVLAVGPVVLFVVWFIYMGVTSHHPPTVKDYIGNGQTVSHLP